MNYSSIQSQIITYIKEDAADDVHVVAELPQWERPVSTFPVQHAAGNALLGTALTFPFAEMIRIDKLNPELHTSSQPTLRTSRRVGHPPAGSVSEKQSEGRAPGVRIVQAEYLRSEFLNGSTVGHQQNNLRLSAGMVFNSKGIETEAWAPCKVESAWSSCFR